MTQISHLPFFIRIQMILWSCRKIPFFPLWIFLLWFIPWVWTLFLGFFIYFPYHPLSEDRYIRLAGPLVPNYFSTWVPHQSIPKICKSALVASEDGKFFSHNGVDWESIKENYLRNKKSNRIRRGGSTITQQLIKNAFLSRERTYLRKSREIIGAILLDLVMSKSQQITWYFNLIEFGPNIYGLDEASRFYFKKPSPKLNLQECLYLVSIIPSPNKWNKGLLRKSPTSFLNNRSRKILSRLRKMNLPY